MRYTSVLFIALLIGAISPQGISAQNMTEPALAKELRKMRDQDQKLRKKWASLTKKGKTKSSKYHNLSQRLVDGDSCNTARMKVIIDTYGWPTYTMVGKRASVNAWLLVQHADRDPLFQIKCLPLLKAAAEEGESDLVNYAYLYDRVQIAKGEKQLYATQSTSNNGIWEGSFQPIEDEAYVQDRRFQMGFDTHVREYAKSMGFTYVIPSEEEAVERAEDFQQQYEEQVALARQAIKMKDYLAAADNYKKASASYGSMSSLDYVETARAFSLAQHEDSKWATFYLIKASLGGWERMNEFDSDPDFKHIKEASPRNWRSLMRIVAELRNDE